LNASSDALADWGEPLPAEERERLLAAAAEAVATRGLQTPALFALEMHRPFGFVASQGALLFGPLFGPLVGIDRVHCFARLLAEPGTIDELIARIEGTVA